MVDSGWDVAARALYARFRAGRVSPEEMVVELPAVWRHRSDADPLGSAAVWREMVDHAGYFTWRSGRLEGRRGRRPWWPRRLFRGARPEHRFGMSWTADVAIAEHFARHRQTRAVERRQVWVGVFAPERLLAYLHDEREYLVDADGVDLYPWPLANVALRSPSRR